MDKTIFDGRIHVSDGSKNVWNTISGIVDVGYEEAAFYICDINDIIQKCKMWYSAMPCIEPHYAVKCNDHPIVLKVIAALGLRFDCSSKTEIKKVLALGVDPSYIIYAHPTKPPSHIRYAAGAKVNLLTFDNELELHKIKNLFPDVQAIIRIKYDAEVADFLLGLKFGCDPNLEAPHLLRIAQNLGINVVGVSFHVGTGCQDPPAFRGAIEAARNVFNFASTLGFDFKLLDIGGGFPGKTGTSINEFAEVINSAIEEFFPDESVRIVSEPGTYFVDSAFTLACRIHSLRKIVKHDPAAGESTEYVYYINDSVFGSFRDVITCNISRIPRPLKFDSEKYLSTIRGATNYAVDQIIRDILLPEMQLGDWLVFPNMGAYTLTISSHTSEFPPVCGIVDRNNWLLLKSKLPFLGEDFTIVPEETT